MGCGGEGGYGVQRKKKGNKTLSDVLLTFFLPKSKKEKKANKSKVKHKCAYLGSFLTSLL